MLNHRLAANVHDEGDARANLGDISEVLLRPDADISAARRAELLQLVHDMQIRSFVGSEIVRAEETAIFRQLADEARKLGGG